MDSGLTIRLFGPLEVDDAAGRRLDLGTRKQRAVFAMLALEPGRVVPLDRLIEELWAGEAPARATLGLQAYVSHLRRVLEPARLPRTPARVILTREPGYVLDVAPGQVDLALFASWAEDGRAALARGAAADARAVLDRALDLWRGEPLAEFAGLGFAQPVLGRLGELRATALEDRLSARLELGEGAACVPDLEALVEEHPYRERSWGLLVLALYRSGRQADALGALRKARERLSTDLGIEPGPDLRRLEDAVFAQDPTLTPPSAPPAVSAPASQAPSTALVARDAQLRLAEERLAEARRGRGGVLLVTGEAGIGKTRLAQAAADEAAARGFTVAWGRCLDGTAPAFWPWTQILRPGLFTAPRPDGDPDTALFDLYARARAELTGTGAPLLAVIDDLHWADVSSLNLLAFLAGELARHPVLLLVTLRPEPGDHPDRLRDTLGALAREPSTERLDLTPFDAADVAAYLRARRLDQDPSLVGQLLERTGGNPFYLGELLRLRDSEGGLPATVPPGARDVIDRRVARLPEPTRQLLGTAAVAGRDVDPDLLEAVTGTPAEQVMSLLEPAVATGLLIEQPDGFDYRFSHALVRDALYAGLGRLTRARLHLRTGESLAALPGTDPVRLAHHFARAAKVGGAARAVTHACEAARQAGARLAYAEAVELWELALGALAADDPAGRCAVLTRLGQARRTAGDAEGAFRDLDEAIGLARRAGDRAALVDAITVLGGLAVWHWRPYGVVDDEMVAVLEDLLAGPLDDRDRAALLGTLGMELYYGPRRADGERHATEAVRIARRLGDSRLLARTLNNCLLAAWIPGRNAERLRLAEEMLAVPGLPVADQLIARVFRMSCLLRAGELAEWDRDLFRCRQLLGDNPRPELEAMIRISETARRTVEGDWDQAEALLEYGRVRYGASLWGADYRRLLTLYTVRRGQGRVGEILDELVTMADRPLLEPVRPIAVLAALDTGDEDLARALIGRWGTEIRDDWIADFLVPVWGLVAARLGAPDPEEVYGRLAPYAGQLIVAGIGSAGWGSAHHVLALLAKRMGRGDLAEEHLRAALSMHERLGLTYWAEQSRTLIHTFTVT